MLMILPLAERAWGSGGVLSSAALLGLTDMDALTYSLARPPGGTVAPALAARALAVGILVNTLFKLVLVLGERSVRVAAGTGLAALAAAGGLSLALL
jgi:uncharacterized membrane protein (DUF4010 family)